MAQASVLLCPFPGQMKPGQFRELSRAVIPGDTKTPFPSWRDTADQGAKGACLDVLAILSSNAAALTRGLEILVPPQLMGTRTQAGHGAVCRVADTGLRGKAPP